MALPLSPLASSALNLKSPPTAQRGGNAWQPPNAFGSLSYKYNSSGIGDQSFDEDEANDPPSSPFVPEPSMNQENAKMERSPTKDRSSPSKGRDKKDLFICEDGDTMQGRLQPMDILRQSNNSPVGQRDLDVDESGYAGMDDTAFSTFSAVPNADMTLFARLRETEDDSTNSSPAKQLRAESVARYYENHGTTPNRRGVPSTPSTVRHGDDFDESPSPSPTPRRHGSGKGEGNTTNLLDFTEQFNSISAYSYSTQSSPSKRGRASPSKSQTQPDLAMYLSRSRTRSPHKTMGPPLTPTSSRHLANLLDFDIPPAPTPRSVPTITARELESLKSGYLSEISSLKASLSGKEAEIGSLKEAVGDAERRVGEALETIREERGSKEQLQAQQQDWEKRGKEMEAVLRSVKDEIIRGEREKEELVQKLEESERKREEAETKVQEVESKVATMKASSAFSSTSSEASASETSSNGSVSAAELKAHLETTARDLHALYKSKHEAKVAALKKSYQGRWQKTVDELEQKVEEANKEIDDLKIGNNATMSGVVVPHIPTAEEKESRIAEAQKSEEMKARLAGLVEELESMKRDNKHLLRELEKERVEKGELVAAVDEMLLLSAQTGGDARSSSASSSSGLESLRGSLSRASGATAMKSIGFNPSGSTGASGESRIGKVGGSAIGGGIGQLNRSRPGSALGMRSGIMSNIERMGTMGRGRAE